MPLNPLHFLRSIRQRASVPGHTGHEVVRLTQLQRRLCLYLRALWAEDFPLRPMSSAYTGQRTGQRPYFDQKAIFLPDVHTGLHGLAFYRAAAAHCAAHLVHRQQLFDARALKPLQVVLIGLIEDARVEALAIRRFPGLKALWKQFHHATPQQGKTAGDYLDRLARALLDEDYADPDPWIAQGRSLFAAAQGQLDSNRIAWDIGIALAHSFTAKRIRFKPRHGVLAAHYRDDNHGCWEFPETKDRWRLALSYDTPDQVIQADREMGGDVVQQVIDQSISSDPRHDEGGGNLARRTSSAIPFLYPEWDYRVQREFPAWTTVFEKLARRGAPESIDEIAIEHRHIIQQMRYLLDAMHPQGVMRLRKLEDGDEVDHNAALDSLTDLRAGLEPSLRIMMRNTRKSRDLAVMVLLDLSQSTNNPVSGHEHTVLDLTRAATVLLAEAIEKVGDPFAIHGFCSNGRHDISYYRIKDFGLPYDETAKAQLAGMIGQLSTRMGPAIRHAATLLKQQLSKRKLLLVVTDGEPADIDERDAHYLRADTKRAVDKARSSGIIPYCISLDPCADQYVARIFGQRNYMVVDHVERLPERLPMLYAAITR